MATIEVTNQKASQSLRGQDVIVTLNSTDAAQLANISVGDAVSTGSSKSGTVNFVDTYGTSFKVTPLMPTGNMSTTASPGILAASETITITTS